ncbi:MAG: 4Fe-4S binding protein, partial [Acidobacteriota bacterium]|nr:4Fe-4S binding protein [Acidobacteriota bacterium]
MSESSEKTGGRRVLQLLRRISQIVFLIIFLTLFFKTEYRGTSETELVGANAPVSIFLEMDPLVAVTTALSTHTLYGRVALALILIVGVIIIGRFFCGWICPFGTINHFFSSFKPERKGMKRIESNRFKKWTHAKYYILFAMIALALFTSLQAGLLDPIPFLVRSLSTGIMPGIDYAVRHTLDAFYETDIGILHSVAD